MANMLSSDEMSVKPSDPSPIRTLLVSSNQPMFLGVQGVLSHVTSLRMVHGNGSLDAVINEAQPQLIILDMECHDDVTGLIQKVKQTVPHAKVLLLAGLTEMAVTRQALLAGVDGIVLKIQPQEVLVAAVMALSYAPEKPATITPNGHALPKADVAMWPVPLSQRELDIVHWVSQGLSNKEVADRLSISNITVRHHLTSIFSKLGVSGRQHLIIQAHQAGVVHPSLSDTA